MFEGTHREVGQMAGSATWLPRIHNPPEVAVSDAGALLSASIAGGIRDAAAFVGAAHCRCSMEAGSPMDVVSVGCRARRAAPHARAAAGGGFA